MRRHTALPTGCGPEDPRLTAVAIWREFEHLQKLRAYARRNHNVFKLVGVGTHSPAADKRIASLQDLRALRYVPCAGSEFCFRKSYIRDSLPRVPAFVHYKQPALLQPFADAVPYSSSVPKAHFESHQVQGDQVHGHAEDGVVVAMMAAKVVLSCVTEKFTPWSLDTAPEWHVFKKEVDEHGTNVFNSIQNMSETDCATMAKLAESLGRRLEQLGATHLQAMQKVDLVVQIGTNAYASSVDQADLRKGFPSAAHVHESQVRTLYAFEDLTQDGEWASRANVTYHTFIDELQSALREPAVEVPQDDMHSIQQLESPPISKENQFRVCALAVAWMSSDLRLSSKVALLGGGDWPRLTRAVLEERKALSHTGVLALSGREQGVAILTECPTMMFLLSTHRWRNMDLKVKERGGLGDDQMWVESAVGTMVGETPVPARLVGLHEIEGEWLRELMMHDSSYLIPERWLRTFLSDYQHVKPSKAFPVGVMLFDDGRPPMDTLDRLCGQGVSLRRFENIVVAEPTAVTDRTMVLLPR